MPQLLKILAIVDNQLVYSGILVSVFLYEEKHLAQNTFVYPESSIASSYVNLILAHHHFEAAYCSRGLGHSQLCQCHGLSVAISWVQKAL